MNNLVYLLIGGNLGDRANLLKKAREGIEKYIGKIAKESSIYETAAWGFDSENDFLNQVLAVETGLNPHRVLDKCQKIENQLGRVRESDQYTSRIMDIDILFYNDDIINDPDLVVPHPKLHLRRFTLEPLVEIKPDFVHPKIGKTIIELLKDCKDSGEVSTIKF